MTQRDRVLSALRHAGPTGLTQVDFLGPQVCDKGKPITRVAARVNELRDQGFTITSSGTRHGCAVYVLKEDGASAALGGPSCCGIADAPTPPGDEPVSLFDPVTLHKPLGAYDDIDEAA